MTAIGPSLERIESLNAAAVLLEETQERYWEACRAEDLAVHRYDHGEAGLSAVEEAAASRGKAWKAYCEATRAAREELRASRQERGVEP